MRRIAIKKAGAYKTWGLATLLLNFFSGLWVSLLPYPKGRLPREQTGVMSAACSGDKETERKIN